MIYIFWFNKEIQGNVQGCKLDFGMQQD